MNINSCDMNSWQDLAETLKYDQIHLIRNYTSLQNTEKFWANYIAFKSK